MSERPAAPPATVAPFKRALLLLVAAAVLAGCWLVPLEPLAREQLRAGLQRSLTAFAAARALGAVLSVAQGTQLDVKPAGVGLSLAPGQALKPLNELADRFAAVMLAASVAFGIQLLMLGIGGHVAVSAALTAVLLAWLVLRWRADSAAASAERAAVGADAPRARKDAAAARALRWLSPVFAGLLLVRFAVPAVGLANEGVYRAVMAGEYQSALAVIEASPEQVVGRTQPAAPAEEGLLERLKRWSERATDLRAGYEAILQAAGEWTRTMVRLIALFVVQTVLLPLGFLWLMWRLARAIAGTAAQR
ncbi:hypothetical protein [uncultured Pseudacidovorax sp.]|uniref:hypothetical protein n=1 Tax=uncultured Pseudacidovorax sp. TaxID=679313 RepID=UPI0025D9106C|nr:hypothetical protein [uncultured Pseudacidovorax sp.]